MRVYELMKLLSRLPAGAEVKTSIYVHQDMEIFKDQEDVTLYARINDVDAGCGGIVYLNTSDVEG